MATTEILNQAQSSPYNAFSNIYRNNKRNTPQKWLWFFLLLGVLCLALPWTQNVRAPGVISTLRQEQRPQQVNAIIGGAVEKWFVKEGDIVKPGDTILKLVETKVEYFDTNLLARTQQQIEAKIQSADNYGNKALTTAQQQAAMAEARDLKIASLNNKLSQQELKVRTDEADLRAVENEQAAYLRQINAARTMLDSGAISLTDFEKRKINYQNSLAKVNSATNKLMQSRQELTILRIEQNATLQEYADKIAKAQGDGFSSLSDAASTRADIAKLQNQYQNYNRRSQLYYVLASQAGQITKAKKAGIGEVVKEGEMIVEIVPANIDYAVEMFVDPVDATLISAGQKVQLIFDGFPVIVFSGWPAASFGTFPGRVAFVENVLSPNGKFRVLIKQDPSRQWPKQLRIGGGAQGIALLKNVPIFYEIWRNINGFPPDYYTVEKDKNASGKKK